MRYRVSGAHQVSGDDVIIIVEAEDPLRAEHFVRRQNVLVSNIEALRATSSGSDCAGAAGGGSNAQVENPNVVLAIVSFLIPLVGVILGSVFVSKSRSLDKRTGNVCFLASIGGMLAGALIFGVILSSAFELNQTVALGTPKGPPEHKMNSLEEVLERARNSEEPGPSPLPKLRRERPKVQPKEMKHQSRFVRNIDAYGELNGLAGIAHLSRRTDQMLPRTITSSPREAYMEMRILVENTRPDAVYIDASTAKLTLIGGYAIHPWRGEKIAGSSTNEPTIIELKGRDISTERASRVELRRGEHCVISVCFRMQQGPMNEEEALSYCDCLTLNVSALGRFDLRLEF